MLKPKDIESLEEFIKERNKFPNVKLSIMSVWNRIKNELESVKTSHNTASDAIALCKRAVMHAENVGDVPVGHPIIEEMRAVIAQQHTR